MREAMARVTLAFVGLVSSALALAPSGPGPFKLGTFEREGRTLVGLVREDGKVIDVVAANAALEPRRRGWKKLAPPADLKDLIARYHDGWKERLTMLAGESGLPASSVLELASLKIRPPIPAPETMLNAAVNYTEHGNEMQRAAAPSAS